MTTFKRDSIIDTCPAFDTVTRASYALNIPEGGATVINITAGDLLVRPDMLGRYTVGSVVTYALEYNKCPLKAVERAKKHAHELHWINHNPTTLSNSETIRTKCLMIDFNTLYRLEGITFKIAPTHNDNLKLIEVTQ